MTPKLASRMVMLTGALMMAASPVAVSIASAQDQGPPPPYQSGPYGEPGSPPSYQGQPAPGDQGYGDQGPGYGPEQGPPPGYGQEQGPPPGYGAQGPANGEEPGPPPGYADNEPPAPPPGYDGTQLPPPPPGYQGGPETDQQDLQDRAYAEYAEQWAQQNCVKAHGNPAAGAAIGGLLGALIGAGVAGPGSRGAGAFVGGAIGAAGGAAIAGSTDSNETSPGCPPGYVVQDGAPQFYYGAPYLYAAPGWYRPWVFWGDRWVYRPYPYHVWYYNHYYRGGRGGWRR